MGSGRPCDDEHDCIVAQQVASYITLLNDNLMPTDPQSEASALQLLATLVRAHLAAREKSTVAATGTSSMRLQTLVRLLEAQRQALHAFLALVTFALPLLALSTNGHALKAE